MKKVLLLAVAGVFVLASCAKDRTCECTTNGLADSADGNFSTTTYKKVTKTYMKDFRNCVSYETTQTSTNPSTKAVTTTVTKKECEIK